MSNEQESEIKFLNSLCEAIKVLDKDVQLFIAKTYLEPKKTDNDDDEFKKAQSISNVTYNQFYELLTDNMKVESHDYATQLYKLIGAHFCLRHKE